MAQEMDVVARLQLFTGNAQRRLNRVSNALDGLTKRTRKADSHFARFVKRAAALGAMYLSVRAIGSAFRHVVGGAFEFESSVQQTKIGLASMISNIEKISFAEAGRGAEYLWHRLRLLSVESTATTRELHEAFAGSYGPMRAAGAQMEDILKTSRNLVHAAGALGIDMPQATRDLGLMATGRAMAQVKLFQRLKTSGFLKNDKGGIITAKEWNKMAAADRVDQLIEVLGRFEEAGGAAAKTLSGRISTFKDIYQNLRYMAFNAIFGKFADSLGVLNKWLLVNFLRLQSYFTGLGERMKSALDPAFAWVGTKLAYFGDNFELVIDTWIQRMSDFFATAKKLVPVFTRLAAVWAVMSVSRGIVGMGAGIGAKVASGAATFAGGAAAGGLGGGFAALSGALAPLALVMAAVAAVAVLLTSLWYGLQANMSSVMIIVDNLRAAFSDLWPVLHQTFGTIWSILKEIFTIVGTLLMLPFIDGAANLRDFAGAFKSFLQDIQIYLNAFLMMVQDARKFWVELFGGKVKEKFQAISRPHVTQRTATEEAKEPKFAFGEAPGTRSTTVNDFRGSKITLKQEFRQADPDRIAIQMIEDLARFAEQRTTSGFVPASTG